MDAGSTAGDDEVAGPPVTGSPAERESGEHTAERATPETGSAGGRRKPAITRRDDAPSEDDEPGQGGVMPSEPPEPQEINTENAAFVLLGVVLVVAFLVGAVAGL